MTFLKEENLKSVLIKWQTEVSKESVQKTPIKINSEMYSLQHLTKEQTRDFR